MNFTLEDFNRWVAQLEAAGYTNRSPEEVERIRALLKAGATMTAPVRTYP
mgnify:CR=1 FL=1